MQNLIKKTMQSQAKRVLVTIGKGFEEIETCSTVDVLRRAGVEVTLASIMGKDSGLLLEGSRHITFQCDAVKHFN